MNFGSRFGPSLLLGPLVRGGFPLPPAYDPRSCSGSRSRAAASNLGSLEPASPRLGSPLSVKTEKCGGPARIEILCCRVLPERDPRGTFSVA